MSGYFQRQAEEQEAETERLAQVDAELEATDTLLQAKCREVDALIEERTRLGKEHGETVATLWEAIRSAERAIHSMLDARIFPGQTVEIRDLLPEGAEGEVIAALGRIERLPRS